ncbi:MAG: 1,6-anhydro-N-acetylmuramyl-L-alanine amidase AmpD [Gammaproteobacteria bacterium]|nr:1,6-anhydro-N-acetylmuramyl-L-alanine amidase AmpD [Gammaproteobacteria bacterium]
MTQRHWELDGARRWLLGVERRLSPNRDRRPDAADITLIVVHGISLPPGEFGGPWIDALFMNHLDTGAHPYFRHLEGLEVSAHVVIHRDGRVVQYVPFPERAWHAGRSCFRGRDHCNDFSIGIELEGSDEIPYTEVQYRCLAGIAVALRRAYPGIAADAIAGHADVAPGRKTDPGPAFDWPRLAGLLDGSHLA